MSEDIRTDEWLRDYGKELPSGKVSCIRCSWLFDSWPEFFRHFRGFHTIQGDEARVEAEEYVDEWRKMMGFEVDCSGAAEESNQAAELNLSLKKF